MTENVNEEQFEELPEDVDDDLDDSVSPDLGKLEDHDLPDYDPDVEFEEDDENGND